MKGIILICLLISSDVALAQVSGQYGVDLASSTSTTSSPGFVFGWPQYTSQNFLYNGYYLNHYGIGFHGFNDGTSIGGVNAYIASYFGVDIFTGGQRRFRVNADGSSFFDQGLGVGTRQNGTTGDYEALSVYNTTASNAASGNSAIIQFYNGADNNNGTLGASIKSVSANNQYGWESDLHLRTTKNNGYSTQTILDALVIKGGSGYVGIGTNAPDALLTVSGQVHAQEVKVTVTAPGPDYVFEKDYALPTLEQIKTYIDANKHLPEVPSAEEMEKDGVKLGEINMVLLKKVEELTLYVIEQQKENESLKNRIEKLENKK